MAPGAELTVSYVGEESSIWFNVYQQDRFITQESAAPQRPARMVLVPGSYEVRLHVQGEDGESRTVVRPVELILDQPATLELGDGDV